MEVEFIPYKQALDLKELGFDEECLGTYYEEDETFYLNGVLYSNSYFTKAQELIPEHPQITTPLYQQAFRWFREKYGYSSYIKEVTKDKYRFYIEKFDEKFYNSEILIYEEAELECLKKLIEIVKQQL